MESDERNWGSPGLWRGRDASGSAEDASWRNGVTARLVASSPWLDVVPVIILWPRSAKLEAPDITEGSFIRVCVLAAVGQLVLALRKEAALGHPLADCRVNCRVNDGLVEVDNEAQASRVVEGLGGDGLEAGGFLLRGRMVDASDGHCDRAKGDTIL